MTLCRGPEEEIHVGGQGTPPAAKARTETSHHRPATYRRRRRRQSNRDGGRNWEREKESDDTVDAGSEPSLIWMEVEIGGQRHS